MSASHEPATVSGTTPKERGRSKRRGGHGWMMIACCILMIVVAVILVAVGVVSPGFLVVAIGCTVMMAVMMAGMGHGSDHCG